MQKTDWKQVSIHVYTGFVTWFSSLCQQGDLPKVPPAYKPGGIPPITNNLVSNDWAVKPPEKAKYDQLFDSLQPQNGMIAGNKVRI